LRCVFVSDIHGNIDRYEKFFCYIKKQIPECVLIGGDLLPLYPTNDESMKDFIERRIIKGIRNLKKQIKSDIRFFIILGNDDPRVYEKYFIDADKKGILDYIHFKTIEYNSFYIKGYSYIPPTPFHLKDWERYDISRHIDVGAISPEEGDFSKDVDMDKIRYSTIKEDIEILIDKSPMDKSIFLFHSPPYKTHLDRAALDGKKIDHAPIDVNVGSIAIKRFIRDRQPFLTLHGHIHESSKITKNWKDKIGRTFMFSAAYDGNELCIVNFDTNDLESARRIIL
jgi:Icc-related predicted phosphoesterase